MKVNCDFYPKALLKCEVSTISATVEDLVQKHIKNGKVNVGTTEADDVIEFD